MKRKNHPLSIILAAAAAVLLAAWPQMSHSQKRAPKFKVKVPAGNVSKLTGPAIGAGYHGYEAYRKIQEQCQQQQIHKLTKREACKNLLRKGLLPDFSKYTVPSLNFQSDRIQSEALYVRGVDSYMKGDTVKAKPLLRRSADAFYAPAKYLYALTLLGEGDAKEDEAVKLLWSSAVFGYGPAYYALYLYERQAKPQLAVNCLKKSVEHCCFDALVTAGFRSWENGDTLEAADCWWTAYRKESQMDSVLNAGGKKLSAEYCSTMVERCASVVGGQLSEMYTSLLWLKYSGAKTLNDHLDCLRLCRYVETKQYSPYADWVLSDYYRGYGGALSVDYAEALRHLKLAAAAYPDAKADLALMYYQGTGCDRDSVYAAKLYEEAAIDGSVAAMDMTARMCFDAKQWTKVVEWGARPELSDSIETQYLVGLAYMFNNERGKSLGYFTHAADAGNVDAMCMAYAVADSLEPDGPTALKYLKMAAGAGKPEAINDLGYHYAFGPGSETDMARALQLFERAKDAGCLNAYGSLGALYYGRAKVDGRKLDRRLAAALWREGAEKGDPYSMYNYALLQIKGCGGVRKDKIQGYALMRKAADNGVEEARQFLDNQ